MSDESKDKVISIRLSPSMYESLKNSGEEGKVSVKLYKIIQEHMESLYSTNHNWVSMPVQLINYLLQIITDKQIPGYCDLLEEEVRKVHQSEFPDKTIWETWLILEKFWHKQMNSIYSVKKIKDSFRFYIEHRINLQSSKILYEMFERFSKGYAKVEKIEMDENKLVMQIREL